MADRTNRTALPIDVRTFPSLGFRGNGTTGWWCQSQLRPSACWAHGWPTLRPRGGSLPVGHAAGPDCRDDDPPLAARRHVRTPKFFPPERSQMTSFTRSRRTTAIIGAAGLASLALTGIATATSAGAATAANPYSPA